MPAAAPRRSRADHRRRFMGLVLVAVGAQLVLTGIADFFVLPAGQ
jgi:small neutral amino acid transporter SnatA (MarC family)